MRKVMIVIAMLSVAAIGCGDDSGDGSAPQDAGMDQQAVWGDKCTHDFQCEDDAGQTAECRVSCAYCGTDYSEEDNIGEEKRCYYGETDSG